MLKYVIGIIVSFIALSFVRAVMGIISKSVKESVEEAVSGDTPKPAPEPAKATQLRKCATCATYKPEASMIRYGSGEKSIFFCSAECEKKAST